jgi:hypothetical protein
MIKLLADSNNTFQAKTIFSKEKYIAKKQQKHLMILQILRPTARTVAEAYFHKGKPEQVYFSKISV